ncbi:hypothetical protein AA313_de0202319 [Arthrobotrys entomopaga]|nr:hypothetical protein AA313_de0202319 [Arthrobotrys entomopaga]
MNDLKAYIEEEGPFDGIIAFSHGASLASSLLLAEGHPNGNSRNKLADRFKCAIFIAAGAPIDSEALRNNKLELLTKGSKSRIYIPTAHIWAANDPLGPTMSAVVEALCISNVRHVYVHNEGHMVPGRRSPEVLHASVNVIRQTIVEASAVKANAAAA